MAEDTAPRCRAMKHGRVDLTCALERDHDRGENPTWHEALYADHQEVTYPGSRHVLDITEHVTWEPVDGITEAVRQITKDRPRD
jgi:hypothetical protein